VNHDDLRVVVDQLQRGIRGHVNETAHVTGHNEATVRVNPLEGCETGNNATGPRAP
jgi:hypothetical protein